MADKVMTIIRDEELFGLLMIPLFADLGVRRCNVSGCTNKPTTIIEEVPEVGGPFGLCEDHHNEAKARGELDFTLDFDDFDAFKKEANVEGGTSYVMVWDGFDAFEKRDDNA